MEINDHTDCRSHELHVSMHDWAYRTVSSPVWFCQPMGCRCMGNKEINNGPRSAGWDIAKRSDNQYGKRGPRVEQKMGIKRMGDSRAGRFSGIVVKKLCARQDA